MTIELELTAKTYQSLTRAIGQAWADKNPDGLAEQEQWITRRFEDGNAAAVAAILARLDCLDALSDEQFESPELQREFRRLNAALTMRTNR